MAETPLRVMTIIGTRPEAVKMAPVIQRLRQTESIQASLCVTAQHRQMLDQVLELFQLRPDYDLDLMRPDQSLSELTVALFAGLEPVLIAERPDWVLIQGDTTTVMVAALLGYYHHMRVGHVEAGLRTGDKWQPFPEEINRRIAGVAADLHFAPTASAKENLLREGVPERTIVITGNPVIDALLEVAEQPYEFSSGPLAGVPLDRRIILVTAHRRENFGLPLERICRSLQIIAEAYPEEVQIVYPVHLNPNVHGPVFKELGKIANVSLVEPLDYLPMVQLMKRAHLVLTDSGGLQEEAPALGVPVLVLREVTERPEGLEAGTARLVGTDIERIVMQARRLLDDEQTHRSMAQAVNPYGDGHAAARIVAALQSVGSGSAGAAGR
jgi:UDP-N-acetylglucosamine 2-epimerase (non-hydrolysing)